MSLEERIRQSVGNAVDDVLARIEGDVRVLVQELVSSAAEERQTAVAAARDEALAEAKGDLERHIADADARARAASDERVAEARAEEREKAAADLRGRLQSEVQAELRAALAEADARLASAMTEADDRLRVALAEADERAAQTIAAAVSEARVREREAEMAGLGRLLDAVRGLDGATTLTEVLDVLGQSVGRESARAALLVLRGDRLQGWKLSGFGPHDAQPRSIEMALAESGIMGLAVTTTRAVTTGDGLNRQGTGVFELAADRIGLAVPVIVGGRAVAVVYADSQAGVVQEPAVPSGWPEVIEILARHAARCLEALTAQRAAATPSTRYWVPPGTGPGVSSLAAHDDTPTPGAAA